MLIFANETISRSAGLSRDKSARMRRIYTGIAKRRQMPSWRAPGDTVAARPFFSLQSIAKVAKYAGEMMHHDNADAELTARRRVRRPCRASSMSDGNVMEFAHIYIVDFGTAGQRAKHSLGPMLQSRAKGTPQCEAQSKDPTAAGYTHGPSSTARASLRIRHRPFAWSSSGGWPHARGRRRNQHDAPWTWLGSGDIVDGNSANSWMCRQPLGRHLATVLLSCDTPLLFLDLLKLLLFAATKSADALTSAPLVIH